MRDKLIKMSKTTHTHRFPKTNLTTSKQTYRRKRMFQLGTLKTTRRSVCLTAAVLRSRKTHMFSFHGLQTIMSRVSPSASANLFYAVTHSSPHYQAFNTWKRLPEAAQYSDPILYHFNCQYLTLRRGTVCYHGKITYRQKVERY